MRPRIELPPLPARFRKAAELAIDFVFELPEEPRAITLSGSLARGQDDPNSDVDLWVVIEGDHRQRVQRRFDGVPCELFLNPEPWIHRYFDQEVADGSPSAMRLTLDGHVLYDPGGVAERLREMARVALEAGPRVPPEVILARYPRFFPRHLKRLPSTNATRRRIRRVRSSR